MKRTATLVAVVVAVAAATFLALDWDARRHRTERAPTADTTWYRASDVALLAKTGRPQLVEFFHPD